MPDADNTKLYYDRIDTILNRLNVLADEQLERTLEAIRNNDAPAVSAYDHQRAVGEAYRKAIEAVVDLAYAPLRES